MSSEPHPVTWLQVPLNAETRAANNFLIGSNLKVALQIFLELQSKQKKKSKPLFQDFAAAIQNIRECFLYYNQPQFANSSLDVPSEDQQEE